MCPFCISTALLSAAAVTSGAGAIAVTAHKWRVLKRWFNAFAGASNRRSSS